MNITINSVHPGLITTNLFRHSGLGMGTYRLSIFNFYIPTFSLLSYQNRHFYIIQRSSRLWVSSYGKTYHRWIKFPPFLVIIYFIGLFLNWNSVIILAAMVQGAATTCYVALHPDLKDVTGKYFADCNVTTPSNFATDTTLADKLWDFSIKLVESLP